MNMTEGNTLNVPELRRLLAEATGLPWRKGRQSDTIVSDDPGRLIDPAEREYYGAAVVGESIRHVDLAFVLALVNAAPALLDVVEEIQALHEFGRQVSERIESGEMERSPLVKVPAARLERLERALREIRMCSDDERVLRIARIALKDVPS